MEQEIVKVFGIGLSKTGTSSLAHALEILDFRVKDCLGVTRYVKGDIESINESALKAYDALTDTPIPSFYKELDVQYPSSKFILTTREMNAWLKSCKKQFTHKLAGKQSAAHNKLFMDIYGTVVFDEDRFKKGYLDFVSDVIEYFKDRPNDLLILDVTKGEGWEKLCPFLEKKIPETPFPKANVTQIRWLNIHEIAKNIRKSGLPIYEVYQNISSDISNNTKSNNVIKRLSLSLLSVFKINYAKRLAHSIKKSEKLIEKELLRVNSSIPMVFKACHGVLPKQKKLWNHFWLIDCSEGSSLIDGNSIGYIINVALIEDGLPFIGIVYIPKIDVLYYCAMDKGAFKVIGKNESERIELNKLTLKISPDINLSKEVQTNVLLSGKESVGWGLCQTVENNTSNLSIKNSNEWQTAAGHAIVKALGYNLIDCDTNQELKYNKKDWVNPDVLLDISKRK